MDTHEISRSADARDVPVRRYSAISHSLSRYITAAKSPASAFRNSPPASRLRLPDARDPRATRLPAAAFKDRCCSTSHGPIQELCVARSLALPFKYPCFAINHSLSRDTTVARSPASALRNSPPASRLRLPSARVSASTEPTYSRPPVLIPVSRSWGVADMGGQTHRNGL